MHNAGLDKSQAGNKIAGRNINNFRYADDTTLITESKEELKNLLMRIKEESEKTGLKLNIQKTKIMAYTPSLQGKWKEKKWKQGQILFPWAPKLLQMVTAAMKLRCLLLGRKAMTNLDSVFKNRDITLLTKVHIVEALIFQ